MPFLDKLLGGGTAPTGVYGILGPTGIGKTHLASMIACNGATRGSAFQDRCHCSFPWVLLDIETDFCMLKQRVVSHSAKVARDNFGCPSDCIQPYEQARHSELPRHQGQLVSEIDRCRHALEVLSRQLHPICSEDLYENRPNGRNCKFTDFPEWIAASVGRFSAVKPLGGIVIDGVCNVWNYSSESSSKSEREFIQDFVDKFCRELSIRERCPVWITHQVSGTACRASPLASLSHHHSARCKSFARTLDACFVLGSPSNESMFAIQCTKSNSGSAKLDRLVLKHDRNFATIVEVDGYDEDKYHQTWKQRPTGNSLLTQGQLESLDEMLEQLREA
ncbi:hypothetical protein [Allorhodopirellula heiligendammensis]|uniref:hypothetical protein n=1 Tax=Allorhodopirellula heiligendammensis TaxID=2714739 RepID=UPI0011B6B277|nr:hypothetical protein [Allorhodopirellula heiligendammensis]